MKAKELAEELLKHPDFDIKFHFMGFDDTEKWPIMFSFDNVNICDIGYSDKVIILSGTEE